MFNDIRLQREFFKALAQIALELEHPTLEHPPFSGGPPTLRRARTVIRLAQRLRSTLEHYRCAVDAALVFASNDDDIPF